MRLLVYIGCDTSKKKVAFFLANRNASLSDIRATTPLSSPLWTRQSASFLYPRYFPGKKDYYAIKKNILSVIIHFYVKIAITLMFKKKRGVNMTRILISLSQFVFPIVAVLLLVTGVAGSYSIQTFISLLVIGFIFSIYLVTSKKIILWGLLNIGLTIFIIVGGVIVYIGMIVSGV